MGTPAVPAGYDPSNLLPFVGLAVRLGAGSRASPVVRPIVIVANTIRTAITRTVGANSYTTAAGTIQLATPTFCASDADADALCGAGSEAALAYQAISKQIAGKGAYICAVAENGAAVKATSLCLFAGPATTSGTIVLTLAGRTVQTTIASGDTASTIASNLANLINQQGRWPVTATASTATVTITHKQGGTRGNNVPYQVIVTATGVTAALNGGTAGQSVSALLGVSTGTPGSGADDVTSALAALAPGKYFIVTGVDDATNLGLIRDHLGTYASITNRRRQQACAALTNFTVGAAITRAQAVNAQRILIAYHRITSTGSVVDPNIRSTAEIAASVAALRLYGDGAVGNGGTVRGELAYPAANLNNGQLAAVPAQDAGLGARLLDSEMQQLLFGGVSPIKASSLNPGLTQLVRSFTSYSLDANSMPTNAVQLTSDVTITDFAADTLENAILSAFPNKNLAPEPENPVSPPHADIIYPSMVRNVIIEELRKLQNPGGILVKTDINEAAINVAVSDTDPTLVLAEIPSSAIKPFNAFAGTLSSI